jgi:hypothetical protein
MKLSNGADYSGVSYVDEVMGQAANFDGVNGDDCHNTLNAN